MFFRTMIFAALTVFASVNAGMQLGGAGNEDAPAFSNPITEALALPCDLNVSQPRCR